MGEYADLYVSAYDEYEDEEGLTLWDIAQERIDNTTNIIKMKTAKVVQIAPGNPWNSQHGTMYSWWVGLDNGDRISVNTKQNESPWNEGDEAHYEIKETVPGKNGKGPWHKAKKIVPKDGAAPGASYAPQGGRGGAPRNDRSIAIQAMLKSIIKSGATPDKWETLLRQALNLHDLMVEGVQTKAGVMTPASPPVQQPVAVGEGEEDLPF